MSDFINNLKHELLTQDGQCTADPVYLVEQKRRIYGLDGGYCDDYVWYNIENDCEADEDLAKRLDESEWDFKENEEFAGWQKVYYIDEWQYLQFFLTRKAADKFIENNKHRYRNPLRVMVDSAWRNEEILKLREFILNCEHS